VTAAADVVHPAEFLQGTEKDPSTSLLPGSGRQQGFLIGPIFDLLFIANLYWPLLFLVSQAAGEEFHTGMLFWQVYFITAPHRWITLILVGLDREKTSGREWKFAAVGALIVISCLSVRVGTGSLICLGALDYFWNAWHFASQHHGIFRIYHRHQNRAAGHSLATLEKVAYRGFLIYVIARVAGVGWHTGEPGWSWHLAEIDPFVAVIPIGLIAAAIMNPARTRQSRAGLVYLVSVMALFLAMLYAAHYERRQLVIQLALASAIFHSVEYMAIVTWSSTTETQRQRQDIAGAMARKWILFLAFFILFLGFTNYVVAAGYQQLWILVNLIVAFLHYAYDGMIWKSRRVRRKA
jgi:hypothetical protein